MEFSFYSSVAYFHSLYLAWLIVFCWCQKGINLPVVFWLIMINLGHNSLAVHGIVVITQVDYAFFFFFHDVPVAQVKMK